MPIHDRPPLRQPPRVPGELQYEYPTDTWVAVFSGERYSGQASSIAGVGFVLFFLALLIVSLATSMAAFGQLETDNQRNAELQYLSNNCFEAYDQCATSCVEYIP
jgi:hypothetical protein